MHPLWTDELVGLVAVQIEIETAYAAGDSRVRHSIVFSLLIERSSGLAEYGHLLSEGSSSGGRLGDDAENEHVAE